MKEKVDIKNPQIEMPDSDKNIESQELMPKMEVSLVPQDPEKEECIVDDEQLVGLYKEILANIRDDRDSVDEVLVNFIDMVMNEGDSTSASKEAIVNLIKVKSDASDKMAKVADLMTRIKLKDRDTFPRYLAAQQNNKITIENSSNKRDFLKLIQQAQEKKDDKSN